MPLDQIQDAEPVADVTGQTETVTPQPEPEAPRILHPYEPFKLTDEAGNPASLSPEEMAEARRQANVVDPMLDLTREQMVELARKNPEEFNIFAAVQARKDIRDNPEALGRAALAWDDYKAETSLFKDLPGVGKMLTNAGSWLKDITANVWTLLKNPEATAEVITKSPTLAKIISTFTPGMGIWETFHPKNEERKLEAMRDVMESAYGSVLSLKGLTEKAVGLTEPRAHGNEQQAVSNLFTDLHFAEGSQKIATGEMPDWLKFFTGNEWEAVKKELADKGYPIRPEVVQERASGDILQAYIFGKAFGAVSKAVPAVVPESVLKTLGQAAARGAGRATEAAAAVAKPLAAFTARVAPAVGAVTGALKSITTLTPVIGIPLGYKAGKILAGKLTRMAPVLDVQVCCL